MRRLSALLLLALSVGVAGSAGASQSGSTASGSSLQGARTYRLIARQAREVKVAMEFVDAFNSRRLRDALRVLDAHAVVSDCDYRRALDVEFQGTRAIMRWLRSRFADHDYLGVSGVFDENPEQPVGVLGIEYSVRRSTTLARLGFPGGITRNLGTKVRFGSRAPIRITAFANGPGPIATPGACKPK